MYKTEGLESLVIAQKLLFYISGDSVMFHACIQFFSAVSDPIITAKHDAVSQYFCLVFQYKYLNIP